MPTSLVSTGVQFPDSTIQTTAATGGSFFTRRVVFTSSTSWTVPSGVTKVKIIATGGGGGGSVSAFSFAGSPGGGGGGTGILITNVTAGNVFTITIGAGGTPPTPGSWGNGTTGGNTNCYNNSTGAQVFAYGGYGGLNSNTGGNATGGDFNFQGGPSTPWVPYDANSVGYSAIQGGNGGGTYWSSGTKGAFYQINAGPFTNAATAPANTGCGGGGGCYFSSVPYATSGAAGVVIIEY